MIKPDNSGNIQLPIANSQIINCRIDWQDGCVYTDQLMDLSIKCYDIELTKSGNAVTLNLRLKESWLEALSILGEYITNCVIYSNGYARISFANGDTMTLLPDEHYENWEITKNVEPKCMIIGTPGGSYTLFNI